MTSFWKTKMFLRIRRIHLMSWVTLQTHTYFINPITISIIHKFSHNQHISKDHPRCMEVIRCTLPLSQVTSIQLTQDPHQITTQNTKNTRSSKSNQDTSSMSQKEISEFKSSLEGSSSSSMSKASHLKSICTTSSRIHKSSSSKNSSKSSKSNSKG